MEKAFGNIVREILCWVIMCLLLTTVAYAKSAQQPESIKATVKPNIQQRMIVHKKGINPAVVRLDVAKGTTGTLTIKAYIKNVGTKKFASGRNQASIMLQLYDPSRTGARAYTNLAKRNLTSLAVGQQVVVSKSYPLPNFVEWVDATPDPGECKADRQVIAMISYDPDIRSDGNPNNDDVQNSNNTKKKAFSFIVECPW